MTVVEISNDEDEPSIYPSNEKDSKRFIESLRMSEKGRLVFPVARRPDAYLVSRFLGKVAIEALADRLSSVPGGLDEIVDKEELDELRDYVRRGNRSTPWPFYQRRIYPEGVLFHDEDYGHYEVLHEYTLLYTESMELYFVMAILGVEYALSMDGPDISGYMKWLSENGNRSPLYLYG